MGQSTIKRRKIRVWCYARRFCCCLADYGRWMWFWANRQERIMLCPSGTAPQAASSELWSFPRTRENSGNADVGKSRSCPFACFLPSLHDLKRMMVIWRYIFVLDVNLTHAERACCAFTQGFSYPKSAHFLLLSLKFLVPPAKKTRTQIRF